MVLDLDNFVEEKEVTWLLSDEGCHVIFFQSGQHIVHIEIMPLNYPGFLIQRVERDPLEVIRRLYNGWLIRQNNLVIPFETRETPEGTVVNED